MPSRPARRSARSSSTSSASRRASRSPSMRASGCTPTAGRTSRRRVRRRAGRDARRARSATGSMAGSACHRPRSARPAPSGTSCCPRRTARRSAPSSPRPVPRSWRPRCATVLRSRPGSWTGSSRRAVAAGAAAAVVVVPAGERWPDDSLRPAVEDLWGAGSVVAALAQRLEHRGGPLLLSPEAEAAGAAWLAVEDRIGVALTPARAGGARRAGLARRRGGRCRARRIRRRAGADGRRLHPAYGAVTEACRTRGAAWLICHRSVPSAGGSVTRHEMPRPFGDRPRRRRRRRRWPSARR